MANKPGTAVITGASSGLGAIFARRLAERGNDLVLIARRAERLAALAGELQQQHRVRAEVLVADLADSGDVEQVVRRIAELESVDFLINNAGFGTLGKFADIDAAKSIKMIEVHLIASVRLARAVLPGMVARNRGAIINVSSLAAFVPLPGSAVYASTKSFLKTFSMALHLELRGTAVRVQALCPGFAYTEFHDTREFKEFSRSQIPKGFWMPAEEVVSASLDALDRGRVICVPGFKNRVIAAAANSPLAPLILKIGARLRRRPLR